MTDVGPRRLALLAGWSDHLASNAAGQDFDCGRENRTDRVQRLVGEFLEEPTQERFRELWTPDVITDAVIGGPDAVLDSVPEIDDLAELLGEMRKADAYDPSWEENFMARTAVWELYGRLHPGRAPILSSEACRTLEHFGLGRPTSHEDAVVAWAEMRSIYEAHAGHATAGTDHEVPLNHELGEFLRFAATVDDETIVDTFTTEEFRPIEGWRREWPSASSIALRGHQKHLDGYIEAKRAGGFEQDGPEDLWNDGWFESWKDEYLEHVESVVKPAYDLENLRSDDVEPLIDDLTESTSLSSAVPTYMLGGRQGGILWSNFKQRSLENPEEAAEVLSYLFTDEDHVNLRLDRFGSFYGDLDDGGGALLSLATILLTFVFPREYVFYKWSLMRSFFEDFSDYGIETGYDTDQYWTLNVACKKQLLPEFDEELDNATMLDIHTLLYIYHKQYADN